jgi:signal transduction histidine kinase
MSTAATSTVETALDRARPRRRPDTVQLGELPPVRVDPTFLDQILDNLFENVARYAGPSVELAVVASAVPPGDVVRLTVEDGGGGVPDEALPRLFDKFYRVPGRGSTSKGSGVGMAVVRGFAEAMGARVSARRSRLGGLAVDLDLPLAAAPGSGTG